MSVPLSKIKKVSTKDLKPGDVFMNEHNIWIFLENGAVTRHWCPNINHTGNTNNIHENCFPKRNCTEKKFRVLFNLKTLVNKAVNTKK